MADMRLVDSYHFLNSRDNLCAQVIKQSILTHSRVLNTIVVVVAMSDVCIGQKSANNKMADIRIVTFTFFVIPETMCVYK
jgi:hypothetical protein